MSKSPAPAGLVTGRDAFSAKSWTVSYDALQAADIEVGLGPEDLELLSSAAYMLGHVKEMIGALERAHHAYLARGDVLAAVRSAVWLGTNLASRGRMSLAGGWLARAQRLLETTDEECVERGYMLLPVLFRYEAEGDLEAVTTTAAAAAEVGRRFRDEDLVALAAHTQGCALVKLGRTDEGLALLEEVMVVVTSDRLSPMVTGLVYCSVIDSCYEADEMRRAGEWTDALSHWCEDQQGLVAFTGQCLAHRAEIMQFQGRWPEALQEARRALDGGAKGVVAAQAFYQEAEINRWRGQYEQAEQAYGDVVRNGGDPHPGLARLRLAQGKSQAAAAALHRAVEESQDILRRARILPAYVEIMLATGEREAAAGGARELDRIATQTRIDVHRGNAAMATAAVELARGHPATTLAHLREALSLWQELGVPYREGRTRELMARALGKLGDEETAALEMEAARAVFAALGAQADLDRLQEPHAVPGADGRFQLTARELEVLRLVAKGGTNRAIAADLVLSERTVDRHVSNILTKLGVPSRAAATAFGYEHGLL